MSLKIYAHEPHPEERSAAQLRRWLARVTKDGGLHGHRLSPSFETHRCAMLLRMRLEALY